MKTIKEITVENNVYGIYVCDNNQYLANAKMSTVIDTDLDKVIEWFYMLHELKPNEFHKDQILFYHNLKNSFPFKIKILDRINDNEVEISYQNNISKSKIFKNKVTEFIYPFGIFPLAPIFKAWEPPV